tara:strand:- start:340 stop:1206 length:867 start_codon:yes stop_codon:yes gene_type:complete
MKKYRILILGKSNVGKSSLINCLKDDHAALVSNKLHSSRISLVHEFNFKNSNIELVDTPGASIENTNLLAQAMKSHASKHIIDCDLIILLTQPQKNYNHELKILNQINESKKQYILCVNKIDQDPTQTFKIKLLKELNVDHYLPISAKELIGIGNLLSKINNHISTKNNLNKNYVSKNNEKNIIQELIRESIFNRTNEEVPYESAVCVRKIESKNTNTIINADIIVSKLNHKKIIIGKNGEMIKNIGIISREKIETLLNKKIHLTLFVVVKENWKNDTDLLKELGYID